MESQSTSQSTHSSVCVVLRRETRPKPLFQVPAFVSDEGGWGGVGEGGGRCVSITLCCFVIDRKKALLLRGALNKDNEN